MRHSFLRIQRPMPSTMIASCFAITTLSVETTVGPFVAKFSGRGLVELDFPSNHHVIPKATESSARVLRWAELTRTALESILAGKKPKRFPPFDVSRGSQFQQQVWN